MSVAPDLELDTLSEFRADLVELLEPLGLPMHDVVPRSVQATPSFYLGQPAIAFDEFAKVVNITQAITLVGQKIEGESSQHDLDRLVWATWSALGFGAQRTTAKQRVFAAQGAEPTSVDFGDPASSSSFPAYRFTVRLSIHLTLCSP